MEKLLAQETQKEQMTEMRKILIQLKDEEAEQDNEYNRAHVN